MDDQVKPPALPHSLTSAWQAEQAAKNRAYAAQRRRWTAKLEKVGEPHQLEDEPPPAPAAIVAPDRATQSTAHMKQRRDPVRRKDRKRGRQPDPLQSCFGFFDE